MSAQVHADPEKCGVYQYHLIDANDQKGKWTPTTCETVMKQPEFTIEENHQLHP